VGKNKRVSGTLNQMKIQADMWQHAREEWACAASSTHTQTLLCTTVHASLRLRLANIYIVAIVLYYNSSVRAAWPLAMKSAISVHFSHLRVVTLSKKGKSASSQVVVRWWSGGSQLTTN